MDIKTRLTRCCGKDMGSGLTCHDGMRCPDCFDKLEGWREIERLREALRKIDLATSVYALKNIPEVVSQLARSALQQKETEDWGVKVTDDIEWR